MCCCLCDAKYSVELFNCYELISMKGRVRLENTPLYECVKNQSKPRLASDNATRLSFRWQSWNDQRERKLSVGKFGGLMLVVRSG